MRRAYFVASLVMGSLVLEGQNKPQSDLGYVPVQTTITVEARHDHDKNVPSLNREDVFAYERNQRLRVTDLVPLRAGNAGLELFFLLDDSSTSSLGLQFDDIRHFIEAQPAETSIGVAYLRNGTVDIVQNLTPDHTHAARSLRLPLSSGGVMSSPYLSLSDLIKRWPGNSKRREVILVSSGVDPLGGLGPTNPYLDTSIEHAQRSNVVVYAIYMPSAGHGGHSFFRMNWAQSHLAQLAEETGGEAYMLGFGPPVSFAPYLDEITVRLANQYRVTFLVKPEGKGRLRDVRFSTEVPNAEIVGPSRVYVPAAR